MAGLIICGYPGVGKSSVGGWNNCVDLESSYFSKGWEGNTVFVQKNFPSMVYRSNLDSAIKILNCPSWIARYVDVGIDLADQGYTVLMSTHEDVIEMLKAYRNTAVAYAGLLDRAAPETIR